MLPTTTLQPGSTNTAEVKKLQDYLVSQGLLTEAQKATGYGNYGPATTAAVSALQKKLGVDTSQGGVGYFGPQTFAAAQKPAQTTQAPVPGGLVMPSNMQMPGLSAPVVPAPAAPAMNPNPFNPSNVNISAPTNMSSTTPATSTPFGSTNANPTPTFEELMKTFQSQVPINNESLSSPNGYNSNSSSLNIQMPAPLKPADISGVTSYPVRSNVNDPVQSPTTPTPAYGNANIDPKMVADTINTANGNPTNYSAPDSRGVLSQLIADRAMNRGLYAVEPGLQLSPEQITARRNAADHFYTTQVSDLINKETKQATGVDTSLYSGTPTKATPYVQALLSNPDVAKSPTYLKQLSAMLATQTPEQQIETVKRVIMQTLPVSQQNQFTSNDNVSGQIGGALAYLPQDITNNPYKYQAQKLVTYFGGAKDPKYNEFKGIVGNITAPYLNNLYGAVLSSGELARANQFVPDLEVDDTATVFQKLKLLQATTKFANEKLLSRYTGAPEPQFDDFIRQSLNPDTPQSSSTSGSTAGGINPGWNW